MPGLRSARTAAGWMHACLGILLLALGAAAFSAVASQLQLAQAESDPMLRCARMPDIAAQLRCFDEVKRQRRATAKPSAPSEIRDANPGRALPRGDDESRHVDRYAEEVARELGKEMYLDEYPRKAREEGRGGTTELLLRVDYNAKLADVSVLRSSGYPDLDQFALNKVAKLKLPRVPKAIRSPLFSVRLPITFAVRSTGR